MAHTYEQYLLPNEKVTGVRVVNRLYLRFWMILYTCMLFVWRSFLLQLKEYEHDWLIVVRSAISLDSTLFRMGCFFASILIIAFLKHYVKRFIVTNQRVLVVSGIFGVDVAAIMYKQINNVTVRVSLIQKLFGVGTILIDSGKIHTRWSFKHPRTETQYDMFEHIDDPYTVYTALQAQMMDK